ncbi:hypothetical protein [Hymenobacter sp. B1770]|uniref:hypothetical protein n=1 Tax=Hymenobacter sp. B1770 TaxID=1718788 RepID=UPI003CEF7C4A
MKHIFIISVLTLLCRTSFAQAGLPIRGSDWGKSDEHIKSRLLSEPGFERYRVNDGDGTRIVIYRSVDGMREMLAYSFRNDSLVAVTRSMPLQYARYITPSTSWKQVEINQWLIEGENIWIKRYYNGQFIEDRIHRIHL